MEIRVSGDAHIDVGSVTAVGQASALVGLEQVGVAIVQTMIAVEAVADAGLHTDEVTAELLT